jgi:hypothetical protein
MQAMKKAIGVFDLYGMRVQVRRSVIPYSLGAAVVLALLAGLVFDISWPLAIIGAVVAVLGHWLVAMIHHYGHYSAGKFVGHSLRHVVMFALLSRDSYPPNEGELPAQIHIRRALGGPIASSLALIGIGVIALICFLTGWDGFWPIYVVLLDNLVVFVLGAFIPLDFVGFETDGSTLVKYWGQT